MAASAFAVESANTVGFTTRTAGAGDFIIIGTQFEDVSSTASTAVDADINAIVSGTYTPSAYDEGLAFTATAPIIKTWVYDSDLGIWKYVSYYYISGAWDAANQSETTGWANDFGDLATAPLENGSAVWFKSSAACSVTFRGGVPSAAVQVEADNGEFVLVANPMPVSFNLNNPSITWSGIVPTAYDEGLAFTATAPIIKTWVYDSDLGIWKYVSYYYISGAWDAANQSETTGWANDFGDLATDTIQEAYGFWFKPTSNVTATFASPIAAAN